MTLPFDGIDQSHSASGQLPESEQFPLENGGRGGIRDDGEAEIDPEQAAEQINGLVDLISDERNLINLGDEERALV